MESIKNLPEERRRILQEGVGLTVVKTNPERNNRRMETPQKPANVRNPSRAEQILQSLSEEPSFKSIVFHELKRATVVVPMLLTTGVALLAINKRFFLPKVG